MNMPLQAAEPKARDRDGRNQNNVGQYRYGVTISASCCRGALAWSFVHQNFSTTYRCVIGELLVVDQKLETQEARDVMAAVTSAKRDAN